MTPDILMTTCKMPGASVRHGSTPNAGQTRDTGAEFGRTFEALGRPAAGGEQRGVGKGTSADTDSAPDDGVETDEDDDGTGTEAVVEKHCSGAEHADPDFGISAFGREGVVAIPDASAADSSGADAAADVGGAGVGQAVAIDMGPVASTATSARMDGVASIVEEMTSAATSDLPGARNSGDTARTAFDLRAGATGRGGATGGVPASAIGSERSARLGKEYGADAADGSSEETQGASAAPPTVKGAQARSTELRASAADLRALIQGMESTAPEAKSGATAFADVDAAIIAPQANASTAARAEPPSVTLPQLPAAMSGEVRLLLEKAQAEIATRRLNDGGLSTEMELAPAELGRLRLILQTGERGLHLSVFVDRPESLEAVRRHLEGFHRSLLADGVTLDGVDIGTGTGSRDGRLPGDTQGQNASGARAQPTPDTLLEEAAPRRPTPARSAPGRLDIRL